MVSDLENKLIYRDLHNLVNATKVQISKAEKREALYHNMKRRKLEIMDGYFVLLENFCLVHIIVRKEWLSNGRNL